MGGILEDSVEHGGKIRVHDVASGEVSAILEGHDGAINSLGFSRDGKWLASGASSGGGLVRVWSVGWEDEPPSSDAVTPVYEADQVLEGHTASVYAVSFSNDGLRLVSASLDHTLILWQRKSIGEPFERKATLEGHGAEVRDATFSPDGSLIVSGGFDRRVLLWDGHSGESKGVLEEEMGDRVHCVDFSPDGRHVVASAATYEDDVRHDYLAVYEVESGEIVSEFWEHSNTILACGWHPSRNMVASSGGDENGIALWHPLDDDDSGIAAGDEHVTIISEGMAVFASAFREAGGLEVAYGQNSVRDDGTVDELEKMFDFAKLAPGAFDPASDEELYRYNIDTFNGDAASLNDNHQLVIGERGAIDLGPYDDGGFLGGTFTPEGDVVVSTHFSLKLYSDRSGEFEVVHDFVGHLAGALSVSPSTDGRYLATASSDQTLRLWSLKSGELLAFTVYRIER